MSTSITYGIKNKIFKMQKKFFENLEHQKKRNKAGKRENFNVNILSNKQKLKINHINEKININIRNTLFSRQHYSFVFST